MSQPITTDIPADFAEWAAKENDSALGARYGISRKVATRMRRNLGLGSDAPKRVKMPVPEGFAALARTSTTADLAKHYKVGDNTVLRWCRESGVKTQSQRAKASSLGAGVPYNRTITVSAAPGVAPAAARFLRERGYRPVYSRVIEDKRLANEYVVGRQKMTAEEMVELAATKGFNRSAMYL